MCALAVKISCNGVKPSKQMIYTLAAELVEVEQIDKFKAAIIEAMKSYEYDYYYYEYEYDYDYYYYYYYDDYSYSYSYYYYYTYSYAEKVIALLFLAAMYSD